jgi:hypothetical protein
MRAISEANSGASNPSSAASTTGSWTAVIRTLILTEIGPSPRVSSAMRLAVTIALLNPIGRGSSVDLAMKASWL